MNSQKRMRDIDDNEPNKLNSAQGASAQEYPYFSFRYICQKDFGTKKCNISQFKSLTDTLRILSNLDWQTISLSPHEKTGFEYLPQNEIKAKMPTCVGKDDKIMVFRFSKGRLAGIRRENKFYVLFIDSNFKLYNHGS